MDNIKFARSVDVDEERAKLPSKKRRIEARLVHERMQEYVDFTLKYPNYAESSSLMLNTKELLKFFDNPESTLLTVASAENCLGLMHLQCAYFVLIRLLELDKGLQDSSTVTLFDKEEGDKLLETLRQDLDKMLEDGVFN